MSNYCKVLLGFPPQEVSLNEAENIGNIISKGDMIIVNKSNEKLYRIDTSEQKEKEAENISKTENNGSNIISEGENKSTEVLSSKNNEIERLNKLFITDLEIMFPLKYQIPDDNSCLFSAISYCFEDRSMAHASKLRHVVAEYIRKDPINYNEGILGRNPSEYCNWIVKPNSWGGAIELAILSDYYKAEICAFDVTNPRGNIFGEGNNYDTRAYLIYDGIHYDVLAISLTEDMFPDFTLFDPNDQVIYQKFFNLTKEENKKGKFTNTQTFNLKCNICQIALVGEKEAVEHAKLTGHTDFVENTK